MNIQWENTSHVQESGLTREEINRETDVPTLMEWLEDFEARITEMKAFISTWNELDWPEEGRKRYAGKLAFARMGKSWVMRRLLQLDADPRGSRHLEVVALNKRIEALSKAARMVIKQRDDHAETGVYPYPMESDQLFDDWAADILQDALPNSLALGEVT